MLETPKIAVREESKPWDTWIFITADGERITGKFTDEEIEIMKLEPREIKWNE